MSSRINVRCHPRPPPTAVSASAMGHGCTLTAFLLLASTELSAARFYTPGTSEEEPDCEDFPDLPVCPMFTKRICGTDGVTYINRCNLCLYNWLNGARVKIKYNGLCVRPDQDEESY
ncbi:chymotrypsin inhibitor-like [Pristis pectinata]|uniref:chymotrypsin inhibitor-like n=1 Tax=Pristis pectinata TaxID=685728 RepID=UPI00223E0801|nr:chymotrypsin inhibitor-like [Pristis pectinata]